MGGSGRKLEKRQAVVRLGERGRELFAMASACARAEMLRESPERTEGRGGDGDLFCRQARRRIEDSFPQPLPQRRRAHLPRRQQVLAGEHLGSRGAVREVFEKAVAKGRRRKRQPSPPGHRVVWRSGPPPT